MSLPDLIKLGVGNLNILQINESGFVYIQNSCSEWCKVAQKNMFASKTVTVINRKT